MLPFSIWSHREMSKVCSNINIKLEMRQEKTIQKKYSQKNLFVWSCRSLELYRLWDSFHSTQHVPFNFFFW